MKPLKNDNHETFSPDYLALIFDNKEISKDFMSL